MQMVFRYYRVAWNEGLPKAAPLLWWSDLIFSAERQTASLPVIHLAGGPFGLTQPGDLWEKSSHGAGQAAGVGQHWGMTDCSHRAVISWHGGQVLQAVLFWGVGGQRGQSS